MSIPKMAVSFIEPQEYHLAKDIQEHSSYDLVLLWRSVCQALLLASRDPPISPPLALRAAHGADPT